MILRALAIWVLAIGGMRAVVLRPEYCPTPTESAARSAATLAVAWFSANQRRDGTFTYDQRVADGTVVAGYSMVRHAGVLLSLEQARAAGLAGAGEIADRALLAALPYVRPTASGLALHERRAVHPRSGGTGLLVSALIERRAASGDASHDELLLGLGRFLVAMVEPDGAVSSHVDLLTGRPLVGRRSRFFTGEVTWALRRLDQTFPDAGFAEPADRALGYLVRDRDRVERPWPPIADHWWTYAVRAADAPVRSDAASAAPRQVGLFTLQVRYESQRSGSAYSRLMRGSRARGGGIGALTEGLANLLLLGGEDPRFRAVADDARDPLRCAAGLLVDRQLRDDDLSAGRVAASAVGAWAHEGGTRMDDQQHALSALLLTVDSGVLP